MRAFSFHTGRRRHTAGPLRLAALLLAAASPPPLAAQWPGEVEGRVVDGLSGRPVAGADVSVVRAASPEPVPSASTDGAGRFLLRGLEPGPLTVLVRHPGYAPARREISVAAGRSARLRVELEPVPLAVEGVRVRAAAGTGGVRVEPEPGSPGTVGDLLRGVPGVVVRGRGAGGRQTVSVRGGAPAEVLVLVDGVPLNDPLTGEADVSLLAAASVATVVVLPGARSAAWGAGAQAGVILVETRGPGEGVRVRTGVGSFGRVEAGVEVGGMLREAGGWAVTGLRERELGDFDYRPPAGIGGSGAVRENADVTRTVATASLDGRAAGGAVRVRLRGETVDRGLPGRSFAPSPDGRQTDDRGQAAVGWDGEVAEVGVSADLHGAVVRSRIRDSAPPAGIPYDERTRAWTGGARLRAGPRGLGAVTLRAGLDALAQGVRASSLDGAPGVRVDAGLLLEAGFEVGPAERPVSLRAVGRVDRAGPERGLVASHEATAAWRPGGPVAIHAAHRSAYTPPSLADRYFRAGVGVEPNPDLRGERVPAEIEVGASLDESLGPLALSAAVSAYRGDVRGMIVWAPDYRFVWSPRNVDVLRRGVDVRLAARFPALGGAGSVDGSWSRARVVYDREGDDDVQVRYRPRHTATVAAAWESRVLRVGLEGRYIGTRYPVPARVNALPGFWAFDLDLSGRLSPGGWAVEPSLRVERLLDARDSMIFGFPEPGRTVSFRVVVGLPDGGP